MLVEFLAATLVALVLLWIIWPKFRAAQQINRIKQRQAELQDSVNRLTEQGAAFKDVESVLDMGSDIWGEFRNLPVFYFNFRNYNSISVPFQGPTNQAKLWHFVEVTDLNLIDPNIDNLPGMLRQYGMQHVWMVIEPVCDGQVVEPVQTLVSEQKIFAGYQANANAYAEDKHYSLPSMDVRGIAENLPVSDQPLDAIYKGLQKAAYDTSNGLNSSGYLIAWSASEIDEASRSIKLPSVRYRTHGSCGVSIMIIEKTELVGSATETAEGL